MKGLVVMHVLIPKRSYVSIHEYSLRIKYFGKQTYQFELARRLKSSSSSISDSSPEDLSSLDDENWGSIKFKWIKFLKKLIKIFTWWGRRELCIGIATWIHHLWISGVGLAAWFKWKVLFANKNLQNIALTLWWTLARCMTLWRHITHRWNISEPQWNSKMAAP